MTRRARLTLFSVLLVAVLTGLISGIYLKSQIEKQFQFAYQRADLLKDLAADHVARSFEQHSLSIPALASDEDLAGRLQLIITLSVNLLEVTVCDLRNRVVLSTDLTRRVNDAFPRDYPDYGRVANNSGLLEKIRVLRQAGKYYQLSQALVVDGQATLVVSVVIFPALFREEILREMEKAAIISLLSILGCSVIAFVFSNVAFKPLENVTKMLDDLTRGEYVSQDTAPLPRSGQDEFGLVVSKVNLLGQQLGNFERLLDQLEEAVLVFSRDRNLVVASGALEKFLGRRRMELMGLSMREIFPSDAPVGFFLDQIVETGVSVRNFRVRLLADDRAAHVNGKGKLSHVLLSVELLESFAGGARKNAGVLVRLSDPEAQRQLQGQLQTAERLSAISRVTSGVAHEVKNPLNAILMHVELARMKLAKGDTEIGQQMDIIGSEILRLDRVVKTFLDFTRPMELKMTEIPIDKFLTDLADLARPQAQAAGLKLAVDLKADGATISADVDLLKQALLNIVVNAIEATPRGGELRLESSVDGAEAEVRISDTGCGIPPEKRERIFQLYFTTKAKGSGIGLALTFRMVQLHNGKINFNSDPGKGTTFVLRFPMEGSS